MQVVTTYFLKVLNILFPPRCYGCRKKDISLCDKCLQKCAKAIDAPSIYITSIYNFRDPLIKKTIHAIKYYHRQDLIEPLTRELVKELQKMNFASQNSFSPTTDYLLLTTNWTLVPTPMSRLRKYIRGYNQAELIAKEISQKCNMAYNPNILKRSKTTKRQVKTSTKGERLKNQNNSFVVMSDIKDMNIIIVDDVTTTGATISEARQTLLKAGAKSVRAVTLAH